MSKNKRKRRSPRKRSQVRLDCPHCGKSVVVQELIGYQNAVPCPACHIPINREFVELAQSSYEAEQDADPETEATADPVAQAETGETEPQQEEETA